ncbi:MAG TPA: SDR family oxidoreductase [Candidatus Polarisedimenticolia bacterium]|nr:SDR family oxidoreductase [Candidatus Polarisedimenticolia bacterium]
MILVTGAGGTVGRELVRSLTAMQAPFRAGYRSAEKAQLARSAGMDAVVFDYERLDSIRAALEGVDGVFLLSSQPGLEPALVREAKPAGVRRLVKLSVWGAPTEAFSFARQHRPVERAIESSGVPYTFLRPNGFFQNILNFYSTTIRAQGAFYIPAGEARISHIDARDIAAVAARTLLDDGHAGMSYELSGPEALTYSEIAEKLSAAAGKTIRYVDLPEAEFRAGLLAAGADPAAAEALIDLVHYYIAGQAGTISPAVLKITGREPIPFDRFARDHADAFR